MNAPSKNRMESNDPDDQLYHCWQCGKDVGSKRDVVSAYTLQDRVICSESCMVKARRHASNRYEEDGRDY
ncbi:MAG: hypothetical protein HQL50_03875 [Magnetococcales bacterium]|nr:hypothetical protein [Magnetococcales bacterium]